VTLGITTSGQVAAAIIDGEREYAEASSKQALDGTLPCVESALRAAGVTLAAVRRVAVCIGPGSFTGLRIGVSFAKSLAQARALEIVGVSAYDVAESGAGDAEYPRAAIVQGKRDYYYARIRRERDAAYDFISGDDAEMKERLRDAIVFRLDAADGAEQALRVARIGRDAGSSNADWRHVIVDYGQRPNAVINWEARRGARQRGGGANAANLTRE